MQKYNYVAKNQQGEEVQATVEAASKKDAIALLSRQQLTPISVTEPGFSLSSEGFEQLSKQMRRVTTKDRVVFTRQLATMIRAGLPMAQALHLLLEQIDNPKLADIIADISNKVEGGTSLGESMSDHKEVFSNTYISMIQAGETSGNLDETLIRLADQEEKNQEMVSKIRGAFLYPIIVLVVLIGVAALMVALVLPEIGAMYDDLGEPVPFMTSVLLAMADFVRNNSVITLIALVGLGFGVKAYIKTPKGRQQLDALKLNVPVFKTLIRKMYMARFARVTSSLVSTGVPTLQALQIVTRSLDNYYFTVAIGEIRNRVKAGEALSKPIERNELFLPLMAQMIRVGEKTGGISDSLEKAAKYYEDEVDNSVKTIQTLIEPFTMIILGAMVLFLIVAVLFPIYNLVSSIQ